MKLKFSVPVYHLSVCSKVSSCVLWSVCSLIFSFSFPWLLWLSKWSQWAGHGLCIVKCSQDCRIYCWQQHDFLNSNAGINESCRERALPQTSKKTSSLQVTANAVSASRYQLFRKLSSSQNWGLNFSLCIHTFNRNFCCYSFLFSYTVLSIWF